MSWGGEKIFLPGLKVPLKQDIVKLLGVMLGLTTGYSIIAGLIFKISTANILANIFLQFFITFLPGLAIFALLHKRQASWLNILAIAYALGYGFNIAAYFLFMPFGLEDFLKVFAVLVSFLSVFILIKKPIHCPPLRQAGLQNAPVIFLFFLMLVADLCIYSGSHPSPLLSGSSTYSRDIQYWVNVTIGLFLNFPPQAPYLDGFILNYHYFSNIHVAFSSLVSGIDIFTLSFPLYPLTKSLLLIGGLNYLLDTFKARNWQKALLLVAVYFSTGYERVSVVTNFHHFHLSPFGLDIGFAFGAFFLASFTEQFQESDRTLHWPLFLETLLFYAVLVGAKAPLATVLSIYPAVICLVWLSQKKYLHAFACAIGIAGLFLVINIFCVGMFSALNNLSTSQPLQFIVMDKPLIFDPFSSRRANLLISLAYKTLTAQPLLILLFVYACLRFATNLFKKNLNPHQIALQTGLISTALISILFSQLLHVAGSSEMYFMMAAYLPMTALAVDVLTPSGKERVFSKIGLGLGLALLAVQIYFFTFAAWGGYSAAKSLKQGFENMTRKNSVITEEAGILSDSIQSSDVEGLIWIRENTPKDALIAVDRAVFLADASNRTDYFYYALFAERQMYIEGTSMVYVLKGASDKIVSIRQQQVAGLFNNSKVAFQNIQDQGVDYIVQTKWLTPQFQPHPALTLVYSTDSLHIYQIQKPGK